MRSVIVPSLLACAAALSSCGKAPPPAPTVALAEAARPGVTVERAGRTAELSTDLRLEDGSELRTPESGRASFRLDGGAWVLLSSKTRVKVAAGRVELLAGRLWIDAREVEPLTVVAGATTITASSAGLAVEVDERGLHAYCVSGQLTYAVKGPKDASNRLEAGMALRVAPGGAVKEEPEAQWDDWTGGLAEPGPPRAPEPAGVGLLAARGLEESGQGRQPLLLRRHDVRVVIDGDLVVTDVEQVFFNPRSEMLRGLYTLRLPPGAILAGFEVRDEGEPSLWGAAIERMLPRVVGRSADVPLGGISLQWSGPDRYRAPIPSLAAGKTRVVRVRYVEWLARRDGRRTWVYPMGGVSPPLIGELSLEVDVSGAGAKAVEAGMGARAEGKKIVLRKSDFRPRADFALDLLDEGRGKQLPAYYTSDGDAVGKGYLVVNVEPPFGPPPATVDMVLLVDTSAATDPTRLDLERAVVDAVLRQLSPRDRVAVLGASLGARPLGATPGLAPVTPQRIEELLEALAHEPPAGATDLGAAIEQAAALLPSGKGVVVYLGDGQPSVGALLPAHLEERLARLGHRPRLFAVGVGPDARMDLLGAVSGLALRVGDRPEASHAAYRLLAAATLPTLREVAVDLGSTVDVVFPATSPVVSPDRPLRVLARLRGAPPKRLRLSGLRDGERFTVDLPLAPRGASEGGDVRRRWATERLHDLLARGAGKEAVVEIGTRFGLVTPWSALVTSDVAGYRPLVDDGSSLEGTFVPLAQRDLAPEDTPIALEEGTTSTLSGSASFETLYGRLIDERDEAVRSCYERKAAGHPELSGRMEVKLRIGLGGEIAEARQLSSTVRSAEVEACVLRAARAMRLPPPPDGKPHEVVRAWQFAPEDGGAASGRCSTASRQYLAVRRGLWRERLDASSGVDGAMAVWRGARRACELRTWLDRRSLLDLLRVRVGNTLRQVDLYHRFAGQADAQAHLRREILRAVRTAEDVRAVRGGLSLDGGISDELLEAQLKKASDPAGRVRVLRQFLALAPEGIALRLRLLRALEEARQIDEARRLAASLRSDPAADLTTRQAVGEFYARQKLDGEAASAFSEIVEFAPFDPLARRRLGDLLRAHGRHADAYREYTTLAWLLPQDASVPLLLAQAAAGEGRLDEALRLEEKVAEAVEARESGNGAPTWARCWMSLQMAALRAEARKGGDQGMAAQLASRGRSQGLLSRAGETLVAVTWAHPEGRLELTTTAPGDKVSQRVPVQGGAVGLEAIRMKRQPAGAHTVTVRAPASDKLRSFDAQLWVLWDEAQPKEQLVRLPITVKPNTGDLVFVLDQRTVKPR